MPTRSTSTPIPATAPPILTVRALNRATLARQMLLSRQTCPASEVIEHLVGMQAQNPKDPYIGLWTRLEGFGTEELARLMSDRRVVRIALMRSTIHTVTDRDCLTLRPLMAPMLERSMKGNFGKHLVGLDPEAVAAAGRKATEAAPRTFAEIGAELAERWPGRPAEALAQGVRAWVPMVQVPPRGLWGKSGPVAHMPAEAWLGRPLEADPSIDDVVLRYLAAFGPASVKDVQTWCGLTKLREVIDRLRPGLLTFRDEKGVELFDLPDAPRPDPKIPAPVRFLPEYDNVFLSHADRARIVADEHRPLVLMENGYTSMFLLDGFLSGTWKIVRERGTATLNVRPIRTLSKRERTAVADEGARLLAFVEAGAVHDVRFTEGLT